MTPEAIERLSGAVPRYTSYPTAPHFHAGVGAGEHARWLEALDPQARLSLYLHVPFCDRLCWYCGCTTKATQRHAPVARYAERLAAEIERVAARLPPTHRVSHVHWGGGSPNVLDASEILHLGACLDARMMFAEDAERAVEIDPRRLASDQVAAFARIGINRVSVGVQDFDTTVQAAINRMQSFDATRRAIELFREAGVASVNIDLVYGLPHQTCATVAQTIDAVITLAPERIALFGYAHLPQRLVHQRLIDPDALPDAGQRLAQMSVATERLRAAGYAQIGLDHFARPSDRLASGALHRNFQGYTTDTADALIGLGASAISRFPEGYTQNAPATADYERRIDAGGFATQRGFALSRQDRARALVIEAVMCGLRFPADLLRKTYPDLAGELIAEARRVLEDDVDGLVAPDPAGIFRVTEPGRPFVRTIASRFDAYLGQGHAMHAQAV